MPQIPNKLPQFFYFIISKNKILLFFIINALIWALGTVLRPYFLKDIIDDIIANKEINLIIISAIFYLIINYIMVINFRLSDYIRLKALPQIRKLLVTTLFNILIAHSYQFFQNNLAGSFANKISDVTSGTISIINIIDELFSNLILISISIIILYFVHPYFSFALIIWMFLITSFTMLFLKKTLDLSYKFSHARSKLIGNIVDTVANIINVISFNNYNYENKRILELVEDTVNKDTKLQMCVMHMRIWQDISFIILITAKVFLLIYLYKHSIVTIGDFVLILNISTSLAQSTWWIVNQASKFAEQLGQCSQGLNLITKPYTITEIKDPIIIEKLKGEIRFENVNFSYDVNQIFTNKNLTIKPYSKVGLVGYSGSGKSSFVNLIMRFFDCNKGKIYIDGYDITKLKFSSLRKNIAYIPQDSIIFHRTILENIAYGNINAAKSQIINAAKKANAHEFIIKLKNGYNTIVGERGIKLSGGQKQRIAIARAILKNAPILIMDEATSALDTVTEKEIQISLENIMQNKTAIVIAHRLSTLEKMDRILVFNEGKIVEDGTHEELLKIKGHFYEMWSKQNLGLLPSQKSEI